MASNLNNFTGNVGGLSSLQASLAASGQGNNSFGQRGLGKLDNDVGGFGSSAFGNSSYGGGSRGDFDAFNRDADRLANASAVFSANQNQQSNSVNRQSSNGSRPMSDTIVIANVII